MSFESLILLTTICFFAMVSPGPDFVIVTRNALAYPMKQALATALGIVAGGLLHATYCVVGLALVISQSIVLFSSIKYAGAAYLIYLGIKGLRSSGAPVTSESVKIRRHSPSSIRAFSEGFLCNALNPKCAVFLLSLFTQFITADASLVQKFQVGAIFVGESLLYWPLLVVILQRQAIRLFLRQWQHVMDKVCGALLVGFGIRVALSRD